MVEAVEFRDGVAAVKGDRGELVFRLDATPLDIKSQVEATGSKLNSPLIEVPALGVRNRGEHWLELMYDLGSYGSELEQIPAKFRSLRRMDAIAFICIESEAESGEMAIDLDELPFDFGVPFDLVDAYLNRRPTMLFTADDS